MSRQVNAMVPVGYEVISSQKESADTVTLVLQAQDGVAPFAVSPGQFNMLYAFGVGEIPVSVSAIPPHSDTLHHTIRGVGAVSKKLMSLRVGDPLGVRGAFGQGWPMEQAKGKDLLLVAGGIGLAPLKPVIEQVRARPQDFGRVQIFYGARAPQDRIFLSALEEWAACQHVTFEMTVDTANHDWSGHVGVVTELMAHVSCRDGDNTLALLCGPEVMMHFSILTLLEQGLGVENIFLSMERNMKCAVGFCGHCQLGPDFICKDGPVFNFAHLQPRFRIREL